VSAIKPPPVIPAFWATLDEDLVPMPNDRFGYTEKDLSRAYGFRVPS